MSRLLSGVILEKDEHFNNYYFRFNGGAKLKADMTQVLLWELLHRDQHSEPGRVPEATVDDMADRFLSWDLPPGFSPDGGIEFTPIANYWPTGTNLFCYEEAKEMVRYMLAAAPAPDAENNDA